MKSKETETLSPDPILVELKELKVMYEYLEDQVKLKEDTIVRLEHIRKFTLRVFVKIRTI
jgi:hypothetical protein